MCVPLEKGYASWFGGFMRWFLRVAGIIVFILLAVATIAGLQSPDFEVEVSRTIDSTPEKIFENLESLKNWAPWSPWFERDNTIKMAYSGSEKGVGAIQNWISEKSGSGEIKILEIEPNKRVKFEISFKDFNTKNVGEFILTPEGDPQAAIKKTNVKWIMHGQNSFFMRFLWLLGRLERNLIKDFDRGLELLNEKVKNK